MRNITERQAAAMTACVALLAALDPDRTTGERSEFMRAAIESALEATGTQKRAMSDAAAILACFEIREELA